MLISMIAPDGLTRKVYFAKDDPVEAIGDSGLALSLLQEIAVAAKKVAARGVAGEMITAGAMQVFIEPRSKPPTVVLCGAGHLAFHIARYARSVHFRVVVYDERPDYANRERFPDADDVVVGDFTRVFDIVRVDAASYVVIVTRGHECDEIVLEQAVRTDAHYIGMVGSRQKTKTLMQRLRDKGVAQGLLDRVYSPIGVSIGAVTAEEIALSIVCELVKVRRLGAEAPVGHMALSQQVGAS